PSPMAQPPAAVLTAQTAALLALARVGGEDLQDRVRDRVLALLSRGLTTEQALVSLRALGVSYCRHGSPDKVARERASAALDSIYPSHDSRVNEQLCELLVYLDAPSVVRKTMPLMADAVTQE